ncbi:endonuclease/exonuclease/phosphatase family protein [Yoonia sp. BS5-3]|uniref:Endonuclease/exonuclease/phosphatase family protein n=1 Tax=Yoonia phaeophyticola TaxID=3137369 RepID=A0ABZ2UZ37_9RHOB
MKQLFGFLALFAGVALCLGYLGHLHPMLDAVAIGRFVALYALLFCVGTAALFARRFAIAGLAFAALIPAAVMLHWPQGEAGPVRIYTKNLLHSNTAINALVADIVDANPDVVFLQEVSGVNGPVMAALAPSLPYQALCPWQGWNGAAVLSRWPLTDPAPRCSPQRSLMAVRLERPGAPFWAVSVHLQQPWPDVQWDHLDAALPVIEGLDAGAIVAGDFNTVPWAAAPQLIGQMTGTAPVPPRRTTFYLHGVGLPLDQVWAQGGHAELRPQLGSDHYGLLADVWPSRP